MTEHTSTTSIGAATLRSAIANRTATVAVVGMGYVGFPLAVAIRDAGFGVIGFDVDAAKVEALQSATPYLKHFDASMWTGLARSSDFSATCDAADLAQADIILLCVPTPLGPHNEPDLSYVLNSGRMLAPHLRAGQLVVLESTTYPGTTREELAPVLAASGQSLGETLFVAYSPEREDPGNATHTTASIPKLVGGLCDTSTELAAAFYDTVVSEVHVVGSAEIAESAKLLENIYRAVNIALVNEMKLVLDAMDIDVWDVIEAAATKPFGFQKFTPGPGLGGHCIPIDPFYLSWKARAVGQPTRFIELAGEVNHAMPGHVVQRLMTALNDTGTALRGAHVVVIGVAYKPDVDDVRESPAAELLSQLIGHGAEVSYHDPHVPHLAGMRHHPNLDLPSSDLTPEALASADAVLIVTNHAVIDWTLIAANARLIVDTRNAMDGHDVQGMVVKA